MLWPQILEVGIERSLSPNPYPKALGEREDSPNFVASPLVSAHFQPHLGVLSLHLHTTNHVSNARIPGKRPLNRPRITLSNFFRSVCFVMEQN